LFTFCCYPANDNRVSNGGALVWNRLLCAIDQFESGQSALDFVAGLAATNDASVRILHIREVSRMARAVPLETPIEADLLVREAVHLLGRVGTAAEGRSCSVLQEHVARRIADEAVHWDCQAIVLGSRRLRGIARLSGRGVRERILRFSSLPVLVAPAAESNRIYWPPRFRSEQGEPVAPVDRNARRATDDTEIRRAG
jgi:nucleotide-binding universal stress UspA family protein